MSHCVACLLERSDAAERSVEAFHDEFLECDECPLFSGPDADPALCLLARKHREAARAMRRLRSDLGKRKAEVEHLRIAAEESGARLTRLESRWRAVADELEAQVKLARSQESLLRELSAPILRIAHDVVALPVIGQVDRARADVMMRKLLFEIAERHVRYAILDLTGVEAIDSATAEHLMRILAAARLLGTDVLLTGIRGGIARTLAGLDIDFGCVMTRATVEEALRVVAGGNS